MIKQKKEQFNPDNLGKALKMLQPVSPTDNDHPAHWWTGNFGMLVTQVMNTAIKNIIHVSQGVKTKLEFQRRLKFNLPLMVWPKHEDPDFWDSGFGHTIIKEWNGRMKKFTDYLSSLQ
jgi:hypothetical protein